jgi:hypothetical protein
MTRYRCLECGAHCQQFLSCGLEKARICFTCAIILYPHAVGIPSDPSVFKPAAERYAELLEEFALYVEGL